MAAGKKTPEKNNPGTSPCEQSIRDSAEEQLARIPKRSAALKDQTPEQLVHELQVHQIELEMQAEELMRAHLALAESRDKYLDLYEFAPLGYLTLTDKALVAEVNLTGATLLGIERSSLINARFRQFIVPEDLKPWDQYFMNVLSREEKQSCTLTLQRKDGSVFPARLEGSRINSSGGVITARIAFGDITGIRQIEALSESEERFQKIFENSPLGMVLVTPEFRFFSVNPAWISMTGYSEQELLNMTFPDLTHPDHIAGDLEHIRELVAGTIPVYTTEKRYIRKDGSILWGLIRVTVICDHQGSLRYFAAQIEDITDRKLVEKTLFKIMREQQIILDNANIGISFMADRKQIWVNQKTEDLFQYPKEELEGKTSRKLFPSQEAYEQMGRDAYPVLAQGQTYECEQQLIRRDGTPIWVRYNGKAIDPSDPLKGTLWLLEDITERKRVEDALRLSNKKLNLLTGITRHDINNQLLTLNGFLELLHGKVTDPVVEDYFTRITTASSRIAAMIQFTREYEKIGVNAPTWQDCRTLVDTASKQAPLGAVMVKNDLPAGTEVFADPLIAKVCYNLMDNAAKHGGKITTLRFSSEERDGDYLVVCEDDGNGVMADEKDHIFDRGFGRNTGMGLFLAREILEITGIAIRETGEPGRGARFEMTVPKGMWRTASADTKGN